MENNRNLSGSDFNFGDLFSKKESWYDGYFYLKELKQRKLFLTSEINQKEVEPIVKNILQFNKDDKNILPEERTPILLYICSRGGDVPSGFELIDVITASKTPVYTINLGYEYSMGFLIGLAGHKRYTTANASFLVHDGSNFVCNSAAKAQDQMEFLKKLDSKIREYTIARSNITGEEYDNKLRVEWYLFAEEAKEKGFCDYIIGKDCDIDDIV